MIMQDRHYGTALFKVSNGATMYMYTQHNQSINTHSTNSIQVW